MKKLIFIFSISFFIFSCKKDVLNLKNSCSGKYIEHSEAFDMHTFDTTAVITGGGVFPFMYRLDTTYKLMAINPQNPYQIICLRINKHGATDLYLYNFSTYEKNFITSSDYIYAASWNKNDEIVFIDGLSLKRINSNAVNNITTLVGFNKSYRGGVSYNPIGDKMAVFTNENDIDILNQDGDFLSIEINNSSFLGWYDNFHILTNKDDNVYKINVETGGGELYLQGTFESFDQPTKIFFRVTKMGNQFGSYTWTLHNQFGELLFTHPVHATYGSEMTPMFLCNDKLIVSMSTREFRQEPPFFGGIAHGNYVMLMDLDGTNVREVKFPE